VEAMSQGLPVIYSKGQGFDCQFDEGLVGYHVDAYDAQSVADGIEKVIKNFGTISKNTISSARIFNWQEITNRYAKIYSSIVIGAKSHD
jgi:glycosyltransferase involved in cell wall biosynthesis